MMIDRRTFKGFSNPTLFSGHNRTRQAMFLSFNRVGRAGNGAELSQVINVQHTSQG